MRDTILVLDEGTTSTRAILFGRDGRQRDVEQAELKQHYPRPGWVEHDAAEIWDKTLACARAVVERAGGAEAVGCIGITNQRETVVAWDRETSEPLARAIVWQDRRTAPICARMREAGLEDDIQRRTGLLLDPYFSGTKMRWLIENDTDVSQAAKAGRLALGTIESWLVWKLTGGETFVTDASNASRTLLMPLDGDGFDESLCDQFGVPTDALADVVDCAGEIGLTDAEMFGAPIPITGMAGDQQAATIGQNCLGDGQTKATYGTGAFVLTNMGATLPRSCNRLLGTVLYQLKGRRTYALEGSVFVAGSLMQWMRDGLVLLEASAESETLARSVEDNGGVTVVPALTGLGAPYWDSGARGLIEGLTFATQKAHIVRAALESMAHQTSDLAAAFGKDGADWSQLHIDGGMSANDWMAQDLADMLETEVVRPDYVETTALGAAMLAAHGAAFYDSLENAAEAMSGPSRKFTPEMDDDVRQVRCAQWKRAVDIVRAQVR